MNIDKSKYLEDLSKCVRCGSCKAVCPTYLSDSLEAMGARGRLTLLRGLVSGELKPSPLLNEELTYHRQYTRADLFWKKQTKREDTSGHLSNYQQGGLD
jgi:Fe-S oxidoreductase